MKLENFTFPPPTFDLDQFILRPLQAGDAADWYAYLSNPNVVQFTSWDVSSVDAVSSIIQFCLDGYTHKKSCRWALAEKASHHLIGTCGLFYWQEAHSLAEIGYDLHPDYWGRGLMTSAVECVLKWGFDILEINRIQATVMVGNSGSIRILEKTSFQKEGRLRHYKICRGEAKDFWMYAQLKSDYQG
ncbi:MAG: GNAT family protein [Chloroflexota bacterium]